MFLNKKIIYQNMDLINKIGLDNLINIILVVENIRPAFLIQPIDYGETSHNDPKTRYILRCIKYNFPNLIHSFQYENYQGIIISKSNYNGVYDIDNTKIGQILGYPSYLEFDNLDRNNETYSITVMVKLNDGNEIDIFSNVCKDLTYLNMFEKIAQKSKEVLINNTEYIKLLDNKVIDVYIKYRTIVSHQSIINKLLSNGKIETDDIWLISNIFYNNDYDDNIIVKIMNTLQYDNPIHKGILLNILINDKNDILSPFYPLYKYPNEKKHIKIISKNLSDDLLSILKNSYISK
jgi:hypothetical protein